MKKYIAQCGHYIEDIKTNKICPTCKSPVIKVWDENELGEARTKFMIRSFESGETPEKMIADSLVSQGPSPLKDKIDYEIFIKCAEWEDNNQDLKSNPDYEEKRKEAIKNIIFEYFKKGE